MKILFLHQESMSFVERDRELLRRNFDVVEMKTRGSFRDLPRLAEDSSVRCGLLLVWQAPCLLGGPSRQTPGQENPCGSRRRRCRKRWGAGIWSIFPPAQTLLRVVSFRHCDLVLAVSEYNRKEAIFNAKVDPKRSDSYITASKKTSFHRPPGASKQPPR